jgi:small GTP-binding protein
MKYKVILVGDPAVGKTSLINRFVTNTFIRDYKATIGVAISSKQVIIENDQEAYLQIWDIAGQTLFHKFRKRFFNNTHGALLVFDLTVPNTLENLSLSWIVDIENIVGKIPLILLGNKHDLKKFRLAWPQEIDVFLEQHNNVLRYFDTSALTGYNVEKAFIELVSSIISIKDQNEA